MHIRKAALSDLDAITEIEALCFPKKEAAARQDFEKRLMTYPDYFWLLEDGGKIIAFVNGMVSDESVLRDEMYENASMHNENGSWQMIFGVDTIPEYQRQGCAGRLIKEVIADSEKQGRLGIVLTCKEKLLRYYEKFGFRNEGVSESVHGGATWYDMRLRFKSEESVDTISKIKKGA